jgi:hypothetical protein
MSCEAPPAMSCRLNEKDSRQEKQNPENIVVSTQIYVRSLKNIDLWV